jgi:hypothetical protein
MRTNPKRSPTMGTHLEWAETWRIICQRWPEWEPTDMERDDWRRAFAKFNPEWIREALLRVKMRYSSRVPQMAWVKKYWHEVKAEHREPSPDASESQYASMQDHIQSVNRDKAATYQRLEKLGADELQNIRSVIFADSWGERYELDELNNSDNPRDWTMPMLWAALRYLEIGEPFPNPKKYSEHRRATGATV